MKIFLGEYCNCYILWHWYSIWCWPTDWKTIQACPIHHRISSSFSGFTL